MKIHIMPVAWDLDITTGEAGDLVFQDTSGVEVTVTLCEAWLLELAARIQAETGVLAAEEEGL